MEGDENGTTDAGTLDVDGDALAGVVDLFGALARPELERALEELAYKRGVEPPDRAVVDRAVERYALVAYEPTDGGEGGGDAEREELLVPGPSAFPSIENWQIGYGPVATNSSQGAFIHIFEIFGRLPAVDAGQVAG